MKDENELGIAQVSYGTCKALDKIKVNLLLSMRESENY